VANEENKSVGEPFMEEESEKRTLKTEQKQEQPAEAVEEQEPEEEAEEVEAPLEEEEKPVPAEAGAEAKEEVPTAVEEKEELKPPAEKKPEEEIVEERIYTVPLGKAWIEPPNKRTSRAVRILRIFMTKHMKLEAPKEGEAEEEEPKRLIISNEVNERMWQRGIEKPPRKIRVRAAKDKEGNVTVYLAEGD